ncbi:choice-of-anchor I family protein [Cellulomonas sp.]|uniref:choice-of-anchor I family protein n=1 Tax=Cellulomonas sp. TaxID=40001 RepID=UPI00281244E5|nr:choice-of-anchor I family protein [Cellulomonas sp.]
MSELRPRAPRPRRRRATATVAATTLLTAGLVPALLAPASADLVAEPVRHAAPDAAVTLSPLGTYETGVFDELAAEIVTYHAGTQRLFVVNALSGEVDVLDASDPTAPAKVGTIAVADVADALDAAIPAGAAVNSVAVRADGLVVVAVEHATKTERGWLLFLDADTLRALGAVRVGAQPDSVAVSPDGAWAVTADEGEPDDAYAVDPPGSVSVVALPSDVAAPSQEAVRTVGFEDFDAPGALPDGVRVFGPTDPGAPPLVPSLNLEPEYVTVAGSTAYVTLQEANAIATVDLDDARVTGIHALGSQDHGTVPLDPSDRDGGFRLRTYEGLRGLHQPDAIASYQAGGVTYLVTANEGDAREWGDYAEPARVKDLGKDGLAPVCAPLAGLTGDADLGRLNVSTASGLNADESCYEELYAFGSRSFSIWTTDGERVWDSGSSFEEVTHAAAPEFVNSNHSESNLEGRSDDKGPEPEAIAVGQVDGRTYAFVGFERVGGVAVYDVTDPRDASFVSYVNNRDFSVSVEDGGDLAAAGDLGPESIAFVPAADSPTGEPMIAVGNEVSGTTTLFAVGTGAPADDDLVELQLLGTNDFHGRLEADLRGGVAGAAVLSGAVQQLRGENPDTVFVSAGDNIGASTFPSMIAQDVPTIDVLNAAGLEVSAVGNHEFDQGLDDLTDRVQPLADFPYLGANVYRAGTTEPVLPEYEVVERSGVRVAFVGVVTAATPTLVSPSGVAGLDFGDPVAALDRVAAEIEEQDAADVTVALVHDGAEVGDCTAVAAEDSDFGRVVRDTSADVDAIFSAHTHRSYACAFPVAGSDVPRPVVQGGQYGQNLARVELTYDPAAGRVVAASQDLLPMVVDGAPAYPADPAVQEVVDAAVAEAAELGSVVVGSLTADVLRARNAAGEVDRGLESPLGNLVADMHLWATSAANPAFGGTPADLAVMNPGGLRADLVAGPDGSVTYRAVADVQPFANTLVVVDLTGEQLVDLLEQQWGTPDAPRTRLHLGLSANVTYSYDESAPVGQRVVEVRVGDRRVDPAATYRVTANSFLASGGDGFTALAAGASRADSGQVDLAASVAYVQANSPVSPAALGRAVPASAAPAWVSIELDGTEVRQGEELRARLSGMEPGQEVEVTVRSEPVALGTFTADASGEVLVTWTVPAGFAPGAHSLVVTSAGLPAASASFTVLAAPSGGAGGGGGAGAGGGVAAGLVPGTGEFPARLSDTGADVVFALLVALGLLGTGAAALTARRGTRTRPVGSGAAEVGTAD